MSQPVGFESDTATAGTGVAYEHEGDREADLICEALVREIGRARRWTAAREAWHALVRVRHMQAERDTTLGARSAPPAGERTEGEG